MFLFKDESLVDGEGKRLNGGEEEEYSGEDVGLEDLGGMWVSFLSILILLLFLKCAYFVVRSVSHTSQRLASQCPRERVYTIL